MYNKTILLKPKYKCYLRIYKDLFLINKYIYNSCNGRIVFLGNTIKFIGLNQPGLLNLYFNHLSLIFLIYKMGIIMSDSLSFEMLDIKISFSLAQILLFL